MHSCFYVFAASFFQMEKKIYKIEMGIHFTGESFFIDTDNTPLQWKID